MQWFSSAWRFVANRSSDVRPILVNIGCSGAVAIMTAVAAPVLLMVVGFACDYGYASYINQRLARAVDSAILGSVSQTAATVAGGYTMTSALQTTGVNIFNANLADLSLTGVNLSVSVVSDGSGGVVATGSYSYRAPTFFAGILGFSSIPLSGTAKTTARPLTYINYYILVDNSQSMGIGSTQADMNALYQRVLANKNASSSDGGCVFGCHVKGRISSSTYQTYTNEDLAHNSAFGNPITLRIDSAVSAITSIISSAAQIAGTNKNIKFGLYTLEVDPTTGQRVQAIKDPPSTDYASLQTAASTIDLGNTIANKNTGDTNFHGEFADFLNLISPAMTQGSGASATSPLNYIFLITDGLNDVNGSCNDFKVCASALNPDDCQSLKANATVGVIYTTYLPIYQGNTGSTLETRYATIVGNDTQAQIGPALRSCATSSDWFFEAQDGPSLVSSVQTLFQRTQPVSARITQ